MRNLKGIVLTVLVITCVGAWLLGKKFVPAIEVARESARDRILKLIDREKLNVKSAEVELAKADDSCIAIRKSVARARVKSRRFEREIAVCKRAIEIDRSDLLALQQRLSAGQPITLVSGRELNHREARSRVNATARRLDLAGQKIRFLKNFRDAHQRRLEQLIEVMQQLPARVAQLKASCAFLREKVATAEDFAQWSEDLVDDDLSGNILQRAESVLEEGHRAVDERLLEIDVLIETASTSQRIAEPASADEPDLNALVLEIRGILAGTDDDLSVSRVVITKDED